MQEEYKDRSSLSDADKRLRMVLNSLLRKNKPLLLELMLQPTAPKDYEFQIVANHLIGHGR